MPSSRGETLFDNTTSRLRYCAFFPVGGEKETGVTLKRADFDHDDDEEEEEESCRGGGGEDIEAAKPIFLSSRQRVWKERNEDKPERERAGPVNGLMGPMVRHLTHFNMVWASCGSLL